MATQVQFRGGTTTQNDAFTGAAREVTVDTTKDTLVVHDGTTQGGFPLLRAEGGAQDISTTGDVSAADGTFTGDVDIADKIVHTGDTNTAIRFPSADTVTVETAGSEALRINSSGNVGIGPLTSNIGAALHVDPTTDVGTTFGTPLIKVGGANSWSSVGAHYSIGFGYNNGPTVNSPAEIGLDTTVASGSTKGDLVFATRDVTTDTAPTERMRIDSSGNVGIGTTSPSTLLDVDGSATFAGVISADAGIDFSGAQTNLTGMTSETLDAYEEGTFTPTLSKWSPGNMSGVSYTTQQGRYTKIGDVVHVKIYLQVDAGITWGTSSNAIVIDGFPFNFGSSNMGYDKGYFRYQDSSTNYWPDDFVWFGYGAKIYGSEASTNSNWTTTFDGTSEVRFEFTYTTSAL